MQDVQYTTIVNLKQVLSNRLLIIDIGLSLSNELFQNENPPHSKALTRQFLPL